MMSLLIALLFWKIALLFIYAFTKQQVSLFCFPSPSSEQSDQLEEGFQQDRRGCKVCSMTGVHWYPYPLEQTIHMVLENHCPIWKGYIFYLVSEMIFFSSFFISPFEARYIYANPWILEVSGVGWGIFL